MPLLGRHKSPGGAQPATNPGGARKQQTCDSPLFGLRSQLALSDNPLPAGTATSAAATSAGELSSVPQQISRQQIHYAFAIMDTNKDGMIDLRDLSQMLANLGVPIDEAILSHIMSSVSKRGESLASNPATSQPSVVHLCRPLKRSGRVIFLNFARLERPPAGHPAGQLASRNQPAG